MGTSHEEPMMRSIPVEWTLFGQGPWDYSVNRDYIYQFWVNGTIRAKPYENIFTLSMRGDGMCNDTILDSPSNVFMHNLQVTVRSFSLATERRLN